MLHFSDSYPFCLAQDYLPRLNHPPRPNEPEASLLFNFFVASVLGTVSCRRRQLASSRWKRPCAWGLIALVCRLGRDNKEPDSL